MKEWAEQFYRSKEWRKCRSEYYKAQMGLCERCQNAGRIVHHKEYLTPENIFNPEITLGWDNLELLCMDCHNFEHGFSGSCAEGLTFNKNGELVQISDYLGGKIPDEAAIA